MKKVIFIILAFSTINLLGQDLPKDYSLGETKLKKVSETTPNSNTVERIEIHENTIWLGTSRGLSKTTDEGNSFTNYYNDDIFGTEGISAVGYYDNAIWAAKWHYEELSGSDVATGGGLCYSTDEGNTWTKIAQPVDDPGDSSIVYGINNIRALPVTVAQQNFTYQMAFTTNTIWIASFAGGLRKSTDMGVTWQRVVLPPDTLDSIKPTDTLSFSLQPQAGNFGKEAYLNHRVFSVVAVDDDTLYVGAAGGINKSTDGGMSWIKFNHTNQVEPISGNFILRLAYNYADHSLWAATWKAEGLTEYYAVSATYNGGKTWSVYLPDEKTNDFAFNYYGQSPSYSYSDVIAATDNGLYRSNNSGTTWLAAPTIIDSKSNFGLSTNGFASVESQKLDEDSFNIWIGTDSEGLVKYNDNSGTWNDSWAVFFKSGSKQITQSETYAFPNPFSPDNEVTKIKYKVDGYSNVTIRIFDFGMNLVRTLIENTSRTGEQITTWDGKDEAGKIVPNDVYFYRIDIGSSEPIFGKIMVLM
jgi:photosystem II stability/assembly factor-like uncharacterized protein